MIELLGFLSKKRVAVRGNGASSLLHTLLQVTIMVPEKTVVSGKCYHLSSLIFPCLFQQCRKCVFLCVFVYLLTATYSSAQLAAS